MRRPSETTWFCRYRTLGSHQALPGPKQQAPEVDPGLLPGVDTVLMCVRHYQPPAAPRRMMVWVWERFPTAAGSTQTPGGGRQPSCGGVDGTPGVSLSNSLQTAAFYLNLTQPGKPRSWERQENSFDGWRTLMAAKTCQGPGNLLGPGIHPAARPRTCPRPLGGAFPIGPGRSRPAPAQVHPPSHRLASSPGRPGPGGPRPPALPLTPLGNPGRLGAAGPVPRPSRSGPAPASTQGAACAVPSPGAGGWGRGPKRGPSETAQPHLRQRQRCCCCRKAG